MAEPRIHVTDHHSLTLIFGEILLKRKSRSVHKMVLFSSEVVNIGFRSNYSTTKTREMLH